MMSGISNQRFIGKAEYAVTFDVAIMDKKLSRNYSNINISLINGRYQKAVQEITAMILQLLMLSNAQAFNQLQFIGRVL